MQNRQRKACCSKATTTRKGKRTEAGSTTATVALVPSTAIVASTSAAPASTVVVTTVPATTVPAITTFPKTELELAIDRVRARFVDPTDIAAASGTLDCSGRPGVVRSSGLRMTVVNCQPVLIDGSQNVVDLSTIGPGFALIGSQNRVIFASGITNGLTIIGSSNSIGPR